jgi:hypothetical protein
MTTYSAAMSTALHRQLKSHLLRDDGQEDLCFGVWHPSRGKSRTSAIVSTVLVPTEGERLVHGNASFLPEFFERALGEAMREKGGLAFFHSHPAPGWQGMSRDDIAAEESHAPPVYGATGLPLLGLTLGTDSAWSARLWERTGTRTYKRRCCTHVRVAGYQLEVTYDGRLMPPPGFREMLRRTVSAWGNAAQADLARLTIGIVGAGSVGAVIAEALARTGVAKIKLIDFDTIEIVNLDRLLHAGARDIGSSKISVLGRALRQSATSEHFVVDEIDYSVTEEDGFRAALDCDVLFSCVDRPWPRQVLNFIAYTHLIPVVDGGIRVDVKPGAGTLRHADWRAHVACPGRRCLECLGQFDPGLVSVEREGYLDNPEYINGLPADHALRRNENVFAFSLGVASLEVLQMLMMVIAPSGMANPGSQWYRFVPGTLDPQRIERCNDDCPYSTTFANLGDHASLTITGQHIGAAAARALRAVAAPSRWKQVFSLAKRLMKRANQRGRRFLR